MNTIRTIARRILSVTHYCAGGCGTEVDYAGWVCFPCLNKGVPQPK